LQQNIPNKRYILNRAIRATLQQNPICCNMQSPLQKILRPLAILTLLIVAVISCKKDEQPAPAKKPEVTDQSATAKKDTITGRLKTDATTKTSIAAIQPNKGKSGDLVYIIGTNFSAKMPENVVKFSGVIAKLKSATTTTIVAYAPGGAKTGAISVKVGKAADVSGPVFTYITPPATITSLSTAKGKIGESITITGTNFSTTKINNIVKFNGTAAVVGTATATKLTVTVPKGATTGKVTIAVSGAAVVTGPLFTVLMPVPTITNIAPATGKAGDAITINGSNFSTIKSDNVVKFNGKAAIVTSATATKLVATAPPDVKTGKITLAVAGSAVITGPTFTVIATEVAGTWIDTKFYDTASQQLTISASAGGKSFMFTGGSFPNYLYYTTDGTTYTNVYNKLPFDKTKHLEIHLLAADPAAAGGPAYYITTNLGVAKTQDGTHWTLLNPGGKSYPVMSITGIIARNNNVFILNYGMMFASHDGGKTWTTTPTARQSGYGLEYITSDGFGKYWYAVNVSKNYSGTDERHIYTSTDYGVSWAPATGNTGVYHFGGGGQDFLHASGYTIFCLFNPKYASWPSVYDQRLYKTTNQGSSWIKVADDPFYFIKTSGDYVIYGNNIIKISADGGKTFKSSTLPEGYYAGGAERADGYVYIFAYSNMAGKPAKVFKQKF
jgi:photosystem II stability/assembly factor-like uncharacterized protein